MLFGDRATKDDFESFARGLDDSAQRSFMEAVNEALILEDALWKFKIELEEAFAVVFQSWNNYVSFIIYKLLY